MHKLLFCSSFTNSFFFPTLVGGTLDIKGVEDTSESCPAWVKLIDVTSPDATVLQRIEGQDADETRGDVVLHDGGVGYYDPGDSLSCKLYQSVFVLI